MTLRGYWTRKKSCNAPVGLLRAATVAFEPRPSPLLPSKALFTRFLLGENACGLLQSVMEPAMKKNQCPKGTPI